MPIIFSCQNVRVSYKQYRFFAKEKSNAPVLDNLTFDVKKGESLAIVGRNGAGKSTLMKLMAGIITPDSGSLVNDAVAPSLLSLQAGFIPVLSGRENIHLSATLLGISAKEIKNVYEHIVEYSDLEKHIDKPVSSYSSGMRARLGFAIAKHSRADMLLIDEILGVGDEEFRQKSSAAIHEMVQSDKTVVFVSHNEEAVESLCDRAIWLEFGRIVDDGKPHDVINHYKEFNYLCGVVAKTHGMTPSKIRETNRDKDPLQTVLSMRSKRPIKD